MKVFFKDIKDFADCGKIFKEAKRAVAYQANYEQQPGRPPLDKNNYSIKYDEKAGTLTLEGGRADVLQGCRYLIKAILDTRNGNSRLFPATYDCPKEESKLRWHESVYTYGKRRASLQDVRKIMQQNPGIYTLNDLDSISALKDISAIIRRIANSASYSNLMAAYSREEICMARAIYSELIATPAVTAAA